MRWTAYAAGGILAKCEVEFTDDFEVWWNSLDADAQDAVDVLVVLLEEKGPQLSFPRSSRIITSRHTHLRELRIQFRSEPYRVLYAFDPRRVAILLLGGSKAGNDRWYEQHVSRADALYEEHLEELRREGLIDGT